MCRLDLSYSWEAIQAETSVYLFSPFDPLRRAPLHFFFSGRCLLGQSNHNKSSKFCGLLGIGKDITHSHSGNIDPSLCILKLSTGGIWKQTFRIGRYVGHRGVAISRVARCVASYLMLVDAIQTSEIQNVDGCCIRSIIYGCNSPLLASFQGIQRRGFGLGWVKNLKAFRTKRNRMSCLSWSSTCLETILQAYDRNRRNLLPPLLVLIDPKTKCGINKPSIDSKQLLSAQVLRANHSSSVLAKPRN